MVKEYQFKSADLKDNKCEICGKQALNGQNSKQGIIRYSCLDHTDDLYKIMRDEGSI